MNSLIISFEARGFFVFGLSSVKFAEANSQGIVLKRGRVGLRGDFARYPSACSTTDSPIERQHLKSQFLVSVLSQEVADALRAKSRLADFGEWDSR
jgi:hypothetical protein